MFSFWKLCLYVTPCNNFVSFLLMQVIDAGAKGNLGRFINHSCEPNCRTEKVIIKRSLRYHTSWADYKFSDENLGWKLSS